jgi:Serine/threonine protein kinase
MGGEPDTRHPQSPNRGHDAAQPDPRPPAASMPAGGPEAAGGRRWQAPDASELTHSFPGLRVAALAGVGGMSAVYRAEQWRLGRTVAVKILPLATAPDGEARERFEREARILSGLNHPHILQIHDFGSLPDGTLYLVTEWASGGDLSKLLDGKAHPPGQVIAWVKQIAAALDAAHARGIIHRDLKPANVLVLSDGRLTLADFGLAHAGTGGFATGLTVTGAIFGTFEYMAPEQMESAGRVTPSSDLYSLAVMTYQMLTGRVPRGAYARPSRIARVPSEVDAFLDRAMSNDPAQRPASGAEFGRLLEQACNAPARRRQRQLIGLGVTLVALALVWARAEIRRAEREAAAAEARSAALVAEARLQEARLQEARRERAEALALAEAARAAQAAAADPNTPPAQETELATADPFASPPPDETDNPSGEAGETNTSATHWIWVLPNVDPRADARSGEWRISRGELISDEGRCSLSLPIRPAINYDVAIEFTRNSGRNSVAVFLPTLAGVGSFEVDAWDLGIGGLQLINGQDMRRTERFFPARLENGRKYRLILEVRGNRVNATWDGETRMSWDVSDQRLRIPPLWPVPPEIGLGIGSWMSSVTFHRIAYRALPMQDSDR